MFKRVLMAVAVAAAVSAPAFAEVTISGNAFMDFMYRTNGKQLSNTEGSMFVQEVGAKISFDGSDKLDNGSTFFWRASQKPVNGGNKPAFGQREMFVGVKGDWGTFKAGRMFSDLYLAQDWPFAFGGVGMGTYWDEQGTEVYLERALSYVSPSFGGLNVSVQAAGPTDADGVAGVGAGAGNNANGSLYGAGLTYWGPVMASLNYEVRNKGGNKDYQTVHAGVRYANDQFGVKAAFKNYQAMDGDYKANGVLLGAWMSSGKTTFGAGFATYMDSKLNGVKNNDSTQTYVVDATYSLSKNTSVTARISHWEVDTAGQRSGMIEGWRSYQLGGIASTATKNTQFLLSAETGF